MKPTNIYKHGCDPISSNCVIWQGPDIECIDLCKGDTVSDVVYALAKELCTLMDTFKIDNYDLSCLNLAECEPADFQALLQLLINKICECCNETPIPGPTPGTVGCPDCEVTICEAFYYTNPQGDQVTTMQLVDYVQAIGNRVCSIITEIATINLTLTNHENRITILENQDHATYTPLQVTPCTQIGLPIVPTEMDVALQALMDQYCTLIQATGTPTDILGVFAFECPGLSSAPQLSNPLEAMSQLSGWESNVSTLEDSLRNMWLTICDMRQAIINIQLNCCDTGCDSVSINIAGQRNASTSSTIELFYTGVVPNNFLNDCTAGSSITITDSSNGQVILNNQNLVQYINDPTGQSLVLANTGVNTSLALTITITVCVTDPATGTECQSQHTVSIPAEGACPVLNITTSASATNSGFDYSVTQVTGVVPNTVTLEVWNQSQTIMVSSQSVTLLTLLTPVTGTVTGLTQDETYYIRIVDADGVPCPWQSYLIPGGPCDPPILDGVTVTPNT